MGEKTTLITLLKQIKARLDQHNLMLWASALTYTTLLSLVPFLTLAFTLLKKIGLKADVEPLILQQLTGNSHEVAARVMEFVRNADTASVGIVGLLTLLFVVLMIMDSITTAFNQICETVETRSFWRLRGEQLLIALAGPAVLSLMLTMTSLLQSQWLVRWLTEETVFANPVLMIFRLAPYVMIIFSLLMLYRFVPNAVISFKNALFGGIAAGFTWQLAHWAYFHFQFGLARNSAIYGALAALPFLLLWIYVSWIIVLSGLELTILLQNGFKSLQNERKP